MRLQDSIVLCIGGSNATMRGVATAISAAGAQIIITDPSTKNAQHIAEELGCIGEQADIAEEVGVRRLFKHTGSITHLLIMIDPIGYSNIFDMPFDGASLFMDRKLWVIYRCILHAHPVLCSHGSITLITSEYDQWTTYDVAQTHLASVSVDALVQATATSLAPIRCNVIRPGFVDSVLWDFFAAEEREVLRQHEQAQTLTGTLVSPQDIGTVAVALMTASAVTGVVIPVDGGKHLKPDSSVPSISEVVSIFICCIYDTSCGQYEYRLPYKYMIHNPI
ncbi:MAG: SDR family oxidoreductase [Chloroflexota bacterium]